MATVANKLVIIIMLVVQLSLINHRLIDSFLDVPLVKNSEYYGEFQCPRQIEFVLSLSDNIMVSNYYKAVHICIS